MSYPLADIDSKSDKDIQPVHAIIEADVGLPPMKTEGDAVFGEAAGKGPDYRSMGYIASIFVMIKTNIGLGVLAMPFLFHVIGMVPGILLFGFMGVIFIWTNYVIGQFKAAHPEIYAIDDIGYIMGGRIGKEILAWSLVLYLVVCSGSGMLGLSIGLNAMSTHGACTAIFVAVCAILVGVISSIQTLSKLAWLAYVGAASILVAVLTLIIAVGVSDRPSLAPTTGEWSKEIVIAAPATFAAVGSTLGGMMYTLAGTPMYFPILSEMKDQSKYGRAAVIAQSIVVVANILVGALVYHFCGQYVASPSPGSAGPLMKKITYGIAFPGMLFSTFIMNHMAAKYVMVRMLRGTPHLSANTARHWITWLGCVVSATLIAYVVSSGVPIFSSLASLIGAFFGPLVSLLPVSLMWIMENYRYRRTGSFALKFQLGWAAMIFVFAAFILVAGTYGAVSDIKAAFDAGLTSKPWGCGDNSNSV